MLLENFILTVSCRQTKSKVTLELVLCLRGLMVESLLVDTSSLTHLPLASCCAKVVEKNELPRSKTLPVCVPHNVVPVTVLTLYLDCPEAEAVYCIGAGGIQDPEKT